MTEPDPFDLDRFLAAQEAVFEAALSELKAGRKRTHWMWFIFPQLRGLGSSAMAQFYGIGSLAEARAYLDHAVLGPRLLACVRTVLAMESRSLTDIFGAPDDAKFRSAITLFACAAGERETAFREALNRFCSGEADERTLALLGEAPTPDAP